MKDGTPFLQHAWRRTFASSRSKNAANSDDNRIIFDDDFARHQSTTPSTTASWFAQSHGSSKLQFWRCRERRLGRWCSYRSDDQCEFGLSELPLWRGDLSGGVPHCFNDQLERSCFQYTIPPTKIDPANRPLLKVKVTVVTVFQPQLKAGSMLLGRSASRDQ